MAFYDIVVTYVNALDRPPEVYNDDWLRIIQDDNIFGSTPKNNAAFSAWLVSTGKIDLLANNTINANILFNQLEDQFYGPCGGGDGTLMIGIKIIKSRADLDYNLITSYGSLKFNGTQEEETVLHVDVELTNKITIDDHRIKKLILANKTTVNGQYVYPGVWEGGYPRDQYGEPVTRLNRLRGLWDEDEQTITFSELLLGTYRIRFVEEYDSYTLTLPPRVNVPDIYDIDMIYDSTLWAFYSQKYAKHAVEIPDEARNCPIYYTGTDGNTYIYGGSNYGYDVDGDGEIDGGSDDPCACPYCAGTGDLLDCVPSVAVDCTCPFCDGTGVIPGCGNEDEDNEEQDTTPGQQPATGTCYKLHIRRNRCTGEKIDEYLEEVPCPES